MSRGRKEAKHVRSILGDILSRLETNAKKGSSVGEAWHAATDDQTRAHARAISLKNNVLTVVVRDSVWLYKMMLEKKSLLERFNGNYKGRKKAADIKFRVGASEFL